MSIIRTMRLLFDPPMSQWRPRRPPRDARDELWRAGLPLNIAKAAPFPLIATGHQPWLWHPGILAKDFAAAAAAQQLGGQWVHVVVDHDELDPFRLEIPMTRGLGLDVETVQLARVDQNRPVCGQVISLRDLSKSLVAVSNRLRGHLAIDLQPLVDAVQDTIADYASRDDGRSLDLDSEVDAVPLITSILDRLAKPTLAFRPTIYASELMRCPSALTLMDTMLRDARRCANCYNRAVEAHPDARIAPLYMDRERVELPIWSIRPQGPRRRVFVDLTDSTPIFVEEDGTELEEDMAGFRMPPRPFWSPAPRALLLTAIMRAYYCDLFIHGKGGGVYDRVTEQWWREWTGEELAPMAVVSADVYLDFDQPLASDADLARALWRLHHVPSNVDRVLQLDPALPAVARKRDLLVHMNDDRDKRRRAAAFKELHRINADLALQFPHPLSAAHYELERARLGLSNRAIAARRDWPFALYPPAKLDALRTAIQTAAAAMPGAT